MKRLIPALFLVTLAACAHSNTVAPMATANLSPTTGQTATGNVKFTQNTDGSVTVQVDLTNVPPGQHGFHIHETGDCGNDGKNAGGHFNPTAAPHAAPDASAHHAGDFGNVTANDKGEVHAHFTTHAITVTGGPSSVVGHAVVLHEKVDDLTTQPSGNAGNRIACGVVETASDMH